MKDQGFFKQLVSGENGIISSKRVMGILVLMVCLGCMIYLVISEGGTAVVENLLQTGMVMAASLLGISSVTSIWKGNQVSMGDGQKSNSGTPTESQQPKQSHTSNTIECPSDKNKHC